jgi:hypothetical protein
VCSSDLASRFLENMAKEEIENFNRSSFEKDGTFLWCSWPYSDRMLEVLIAASHSNKISCKEGLVNLKGPNVHMWFAAQDLRRVGLLHPNESLEEFQPTELGWAMLEHFAADKYTKKGEYPPSVLKEQNARSEKTKANLLRR